MDKETKNIHKRPGRNGNPAPGGRPKGVPNKTTTEFKSALNNLLEHAAPQMVEWLGEIKDPEKRFDVLSKFAEYIYPKLARSEVQPLDKNGNPTDQPTIKVEFVTTQHKDT